MPTTQHHARTEQQKLESRARRLARQQGLKFSKSRRAHEVQYRYCLIDPAYNAIRYHDSEIETVLDYLG